MVKNKLFAFALSLIFTSLITTYFSEHSNSQVKLNLLSGISGSANSEKSISQDNLGKAVPIEGNTEQLKYFFDAVKKAKSKTVHIAHYGDSMVWGDIITEDLREIFQKKYGGKGIGFLSFSSDDISVRQTVRQKYSEDWDFATLFTRNDKRYEIGISGTAAVSKGSNWVDYNFTNERSSSSSFSEFTVFALNKKSDSKIAYEISNSDKKYLTLSQSDNLSIITEKLNQSAKKIKFSVGNSPDTYFYGVNFESGNGVYVDNFPIRGNSGVSLQDISESIYKNFNKELNYKLIILNFGVNAVGVNGLWYEKQMGKVIERLKRVFPETSILIVSTADRAIKKGSGFQTDEKILELVDIQKKIAVNSKVAFWNMFEAMGGKNSMVKWVDNSPSYGLKDYVHFTSLGGKRIAELLVEALEDQMKQ
jgi:lysophospholipase L1-like esterase